MDPSATEPLPLVAIVGRPNVGKSTLFNRLGRSRRALVADTPGLTRDRIVEEVEIAGRRVLLVDTAGLEPKASENLAAAIQAQAQSAVEEADAILFVVDGRAGLLPEDASIAKTLRRSDKPLVLAVNKIDVPGHADRVAEFHALGFARTVAISAEHGTGAFDCLELLVEALPEWPPTPAVAREGEIRVAVTGRPNVGKSSLVNRLLGSDRVVVSDVPGTTRDAIDLRLEQDGEPYVLVDTAGLRRPGKRTQRIERGSALMTVRSIERAQVALLLVDGAEGFTDQDAHVASMLRDRGCAAVVLANKWDRVSGERASEVLEGIRHGLRFMADAPILTVSALTGLHLGKLFPLVRQVFDAGGRQIPTAHLNRWLADTVERHPPPLGKHGRRRRPIKFFYATQVGVHPPAFVLFCTEPRAVAPSYKRFLENQLRDRFDLAGTPVKLRFRSRDEPGAAGRRRRGRSGR